VQVLTLLDVAPSLATFSKLEVLMKAAIIAPRQRSGLDGVPAGGRLDKTWSRRMYALGMSGLTQARGDAEGQGRPSVAGGRRTVVAGAEAGDHVLTGISDRSQDDWGALV
jgi:hypothetical protein